MPQSTRWIGSTLLSAICLGFLLLTGHAQASTDSIAQTAPSADTPAPAQPISETKRSLIYQLLELTGGRQQYEQTNQLLFAQMQQQLQPMLEQMVRSRSDLSAAEQQALIEDLTANTTQLIARLNEVIQTEITYDQVLERVYYPVYDQYFTEEDLSGLIAFYETPTGKRLLAVSPQIVQTSLQLSNELFLPRILEVVNQFVQQSSGNAPSSPKHQSSPEVRR